MLKTLIPCLPLLLLPTLRAQEPVALAKLLTENLGSTYSVGEPLKTPKLAVLERICELTGADLDAFDGIQLRALTVETPRRPGRGRRGRGAAGGAVAVVPILGMDGHLAVLISTGRRQMGGGLVLDPEGKVAVAWRRFGVQFAGKGMPSMKNAVAAAELQERMERFAAGEDEEARTGRVLMEVRRQMYRQAVIIPAVMGALGDGGEIPQEAAKAVRDAFAKMATLEKELQSIAGDTAAEFAAKATAMVAILDRVIAGEVEEGTGPDVLRTLRSSCRACHNLRGEYRGGLEHFLMGRREDIGLGDMVFQVGYDVVSDQEDKKAVQAVADAFRRAALLLDTAR